MSREVAPLHGLILAGGASARMHSDKAALAYLGRSQLDRAYELACRHVPRVFVSVRADQVNEPTRAQRPLIVDSIAGGGPIVGIRSAFSAMPQAAWLVLACDLPFVTDAVLAHLVNSRDPTQAATAYRSAHDGLPEPLCAIWEPAAAALLESYEAAGHSCPRKFLTNHRVKILEPLDERALNNVNTPAEYTRALESLKTARTTDRMRIKVHYYALLREQAGRSEEFLDTAAATPADLYAELNSRYRFSLAREQLKVAVNAEFSEWSRMLAAGDSVVFIPPVAGG